MAPRNGNDWARAEGFTIIELLVVITVIGLLVAIAVPAFSRARHAARTTQCLSNLRQSGIALNSYLVESDGVMPTLHNRTSVDEPLPAMDTVLDRFGSRAMFECPADEDELFETTGTSYYWNITLNGQRVANLFSIIGGTNPERIPIMSDKEDFHPELRDRIAVLFADGHADRELRFVSMEAP